MSSEILDGELISSRADWRLNEQRMTLQPDEMWLLVCMYAFSRPRETYPNEMALDGSRTLD